MKLTPAASLNASANAGPFVINLCSVPARVSISQPRSPELSRFRFFLSSQISDGQERLWLHMGYFATLAETERWLQILRGTYPDAFASEASSIEEVLEPASPEDGAESVTVLAVRRPEPQARIGEIQYDSGSVIVDLEDRARPVPRLAARGGPSATRTLGPGAEELEGELENLAARELPTDDSDPLNDTGVRHLRMEIQRRSWSVRRPGTRNRKS